MLYQFADIRGDLSLEADLCVVGSGAAGAILAKEVAEAGHRVVMLEEGGYHQPPYFGHDVQEGLEHLYFERGMRMMVGRSTIFTMQGRLLGGTTVVNSAICFRLPEWIVTRWVSEFGLTIVPEELEGAFSRLEKNLNVKPVDEEFLGNNNRLFRKGCEALGIESRPIYRNEQGCRACGVCLVGCPEGAKRSMDVTYIPWGLDAGVDVYANCRAERVIFKRGRAVGVRGRFLEPGTDRARSRIEVRSRLTAVSAGTMATPVLLLKSGYPNRNGMVGKNLLNHPGTGIVGRFPEVVNAWEGANQGYESSQWIREGIVLETVWAPPPFASARTPGFGEKNLEIMKNLRHLASFGAMVRATTTGRVLPRPGSFNPIILYSLNAHDMTLITRAMKYIAEVFFAAGAREIYPMVYDFPEVLTDARQASVFVEKEIKPQQMMLIGNHPMGTCRMGEDPGNSVVNSHCESHEISNLFVCDASIFPTAPGVNPQLSIMAFADLTARYLVQRIRTG